MQENFLNYIDKDSNSDFLMQIWISMLEEWRLR